MALDVYYKKDIANALRAVEHSPRQLLPLIADGRYRKGYETGFNAALAAVALAFGLYEEQEQKLARR